MFYLLFKALIKYDRLQCQTATRGKLKINSQTLNIPQSVFYVRNDISLIHVSVIYIIFLLFCSFLSGMF